MWYTGLFGGARPSRFQHATSNQDCPKGCPFANISIYYSLVCSCVARLQRCPSLIQAMSSSIKASMLMAPAKRLFLILQQRQLFDLVRLCCLLGRRKSIALVKFYFKSCRTVSSMHYNRAIGKVVITAFQRWSSSYEILKPTLPGTLCQISNSDNFPTPSELYACIRHDVADLGGWDGHR